MKKKKNANKKRFFTNRVQIVPLEDYGSAKGIFAYIFPNLNFKNVLNEKQ